LPSDGRDVAAAAAVISAAVGKQLFDGGTSSNGSKITEPTSTSDVIRDARKRCDVAANNGNGNTSKREPAGVSATKAKSEIQKFYQIKEKVRRSKIARVFSTFCRRRSPSFKQAVLKCNNLL